MTRLEMPPETRGHFFARAWMSCAPASCTAVCSTGSIARLQYPDGVVATGLPAITGAGPVGMGGIDRVRCRAMSQPHPPLRDFRAGRPAGEWGQGRWAISRYGYRRISALAGTTGTGGCGFDAAAKPAQWHGPPCPRVIRQFPRRVLRQPGRGNAARWHPALRTGLHRSARGRSRPQAR